jgi:hypothetical protein
MSRSLQLGRTMFHQEVEASQNQLVPKEDWVWLHKQRGRANPTQLMRESGCWASPGFALQSSNRDASQVNLPQRERIIEPSSVGARAPLGLFGRRRATSAAQWTLLSIASVLIPVPTSHSQGCIYSVRGKRMRKLTTIRF